MILKFRFSKISFLLTLTGDILSFRYRTAQELFDDFFGIDYLRVNRGKYSPVVVLWD